MTTARLCVLAAALSSLAAAQLEITVLSSLVFSRYGDRTPLISPQSPQLTPYGAQQMYQSGAFFRDRYLTTTFDDANQTTAIWDISHVELNNDHVEILTTTDSFALGSAQAFVQGLYPPLSVSGGANATFIPGQSILANGTNVVAPYGGYQYPAIWGASSYDLNSIWVDGVTNCPAFTDSLVDYYNSSDFRFLYGSTIDFYQSLWPEYLEGVFPKSSLGYFDAYYIYDYLQYEYLHNATVADAISPVNMTRADILADDWVFAMYGNGSNTVRSIGGRTLAAQILNAFASVIEEQGQTNKLNLYFGDFGPMTALAALTNLASPQNAAFYSIPASASAFVFELVTLTPVGQDFGSFPTNTDDMFVRFYYANGTTNTPVLVEYPLFGLSPSETLISYSDFLAGMSAISIGSVRDWCNTCNSYALFCPAFTDTYNQKCADTSRHALSPAVAGVVGALVTLAVASLVVGLLMAFAGLRFRRQPRKSELGGFKGSEKLASDQDLTLPKGAATIATTPVAADEPEPARGHERVGSWELKDQAITKDTGASLPPRRPSYEDDEIHIDPYATPVRPRDSV